MEIFFDYWLSACSPPSAYSSTYCDCDTTTSITSTAGTTTPVVPNITATTNTATASHQTNHHHHRRRRHPRVLPSRTHIISDHNHHSTVWVDEKDDDNIIKNYRPTAVPTTSFHLSQKRMKQMDSSSSLTTTTALDSESMQQQDQEQQHEQQQQQQAEKGQDRQQDDYDTHNQYRNDEQPPTTTTMIINDDSKEQQEEELGELGKQQTRRLDEIVSDEVQEHDRISSTGPTTKDRQQQEQKESTVENMIMNQSHAMSTPEKPSPETSNVMRGYGASSSTTSSNIRSGGGSSGESHRIYWQQWIRPSPQQQPSSQQPTTNSNIPTNQQQQQQQMRPELITSSAAIRLSKSAKTIDVTNLLRKTILPLSSASSTGSSSSNVNKNMDDQQQQEQQNGSNNNTNDDENDRLVLVGTLYSLPRDYAQFDPTLFVTKTTNTGDSYLLEGSQYPTQPISIEASEAASRGGVGVTNHDDVVRIRDDGVSTSGHQNHGMTPYHVVKTLRPFDRPLSIHDRMIQYMDHLIEQGQQQQPLRHPNDNSATMMQSPSHRTIISPKIQWFYIPSMKERLDNHDHDRVRSNFSSTSNPNNNYNKNKNSTASGSTTTTTSNSSNASLQSFIPNCVELDGYCSSMEGPDDDHEDYDEEDHDGDSDDDIDHDHHVIDHVCFDANNQRNHLHGDNQLAIHSDNPIGSTDGVNNDDDDNNNNQVMRPAVDLIEATLFSKFLWLSMGTTSTTLDHDDSNQIASATTDHVSAVDQGPDLDHGRLHEKLLRQYYRIYKKRSRAIHEYDQADRLALIQAKLLPNYNAGATQPSSLSLPPFSGYLLKRSSRDPNVWKRVYCTVTHDDLWYHSRMYLHTSQNHKDRSMYRTPKYTKHGRIQLTRALVLEPSIDYLPLYRIPYAFEIITKNGISHGFRACNEQHQMIWVRVISERIVQSYENSLLYDAELILNDEVYARNCRMDHTSIEPLWNQMMDATTVTSTTTGSTIGTDHDANNNTITSIPSTIPSTIAYSSLVGVVLRWSIQVSEYREMCRYIQSILPAKSPVVVISHNSVNHDPSSATPTTMASTISRSPASSITTLASKVDDPKQPKPNSASSATTPTSSRLSSFFSRNRNPPKSVSSTTSNTDPHGTGGAGAPISSFASSPGGVTKTRAMATATVEPIDQVAKDMIRKAWDSATSLLSRATHVAHTLQEQETNHDQQILHQHSTSVYPTASSSSLSLFGSTHSHVETLCRHIDYVITGRFSPLGTNHHLRSKYNAVAGGGSNIHHNTTTSDQQQQQHHQEIPPPTDLFDQLLGELQKLASRADLAIR